MLLGVLMSIGMPFSLSLSDIATSVSLCRRVRAGFRAPSFQTAVLETDHQDHRRRPSPFLAIGQMSQW